MTTRGAIGARAGGLPRRAAAAGPAALIVLFGALAWYLLARAEARDRSVRHAGEVLVALERTLSSLRDAETGQRGYLLTGEPRYLEPYDAARARVGAELDAVARLTAGDPAQRARAAELRRLAAAKLAELDTTIALRRTAGPGAALDVVRTDAGKRVMDRARAVAAEMQRAEEAVLARESRAERRLRPWVVATLLTGLVLGALAAALSNLLFARHAAEQARLAAEVEQQNATLQEQAAELEHQLDQNQQLTVDLEAAGDELREERDRARELARDADAANRAKSQFLAAVSHELRTPLNAIAGYADLLDLGIYGELNEQQRESVGRIRGAEGVLLELIEDLLRFTQLEAGQVEVASAAVPLAPLLEEMERLLAPQLREAALRYRCEPCGEGLAAWADAARVRQILANLLANAVKFTPPGGEVVLGAGEGGGRVRISVRDTGRGVALEMLEAIFEPFVQVGREKNERSQQGVGLGLAIARDLARRMGGDLTAASGPGGSTFTLDLPAAPAAAR